MCDDMRMVRRASGAMHVARVRHVQGGRTYTSVLLRQSYREGRSVKHRTLASLTALPPAVIDAIERSLRGERLVPAGEAFRVVRSLPHGHVAAVLGMARSLGLPALLDRRPSRSRDLALGMVTARILAPCSKLATARTFGQSTLGQVLDVADATEDELYGALDWLLARQARVERSLAVRHLRAGSLVLYDLTSTYVEGSHCPLALHGHSRDHRPDRPQIEFGLLTDARGCPVAVEAFPGNTADPAGLPQALDPGTREHPPVTHEDDVGQAEAGPHLLARCLDCGGIRVVAGEGLDRDRAAPRIGQEAELDLGPVGPVVAGVAMAGEGAVAPLDVHRGEVIEHEAPGCEVAGRERPLDPRLAGEEPVHRPVQHVLVGALDPEAGTQGALAEESRGGELGRGGDQAARHERDREVPHPRWAPLEDARQPERAEQPQDRRDMAVGQAPDDPQRGLGRHEALAPQRALDGIDDRLGQGGERGQRPVLDRGSFPVRLAEQDRDVFLLSVDPPNSGHMHRAAGSPWHARIVAQTR